MATINLLPWRDELREEQKKEFQSIAVAFVLLGVVIVGGWKFLLDASIENQTERNSYLKTHITELDKQVKEIEDLKKQKAELIERMDVIQSLQGNRPEIVHIFDEVVRALPDGVFYNKIVRSGAKLDFSGTAESNNRVSSLMRQLESSPWFAEPRLKNVKANPEFGPQANNFELTLSIVSANMEDADDKNKKRK